MKKFSVLVVLFCFFITSVTACGKSASGYEHFEIKELPYSIPYYNDANIDIVSINLYQDEYEDHGKIEYTPYVIVLVDESQVSQLSEDDAYWAKEEIDVSYSCSIMNVDNGAIAEDLRFIERGKLGEYTFIAYSILDLYPNPDKEKFYKNFDNSSVSLYVHVTRTDSESSTKEPVKEFYSYSTEDIKDVPSIDEMDRAMYSEISASIHRSTREYLDAITKK